ncbi:MAG: hypothetical protein K1Y36_17440 [Blastocatellia bacterium]|nr:hypothetical protein [Blastocatellia bacterium]
MHGYVHQVPNAPPTKSSGYLLWLGILGSLLVVLLTIAVLVKQRSNSGAMEFGNRFIEHLKNNRVQDAFAMMDGTYRGTHSQEQFRAEMEHNQLLKNHRVELQVMVDSSNLKVLRGIVYGSEEGMNLVSITLTTSLGLGWEIRSIAEPKGETPPWMKKYEEEEQREREQILRSR